MDTKELGNLSPANFEESSGKQNIKGKNASKLVGDKGERIACEYLVKKGYKILCKNYRISLGEIDIIAQKKWSIKNVLQRKNDKTIHFVEVKTSQDFHHERAERAEGFFPEQRVDWKKRNKYKRLVEIWLSKNKFPQNYPCQVDIIAILIDQTSRKARVHYFQNVVKDY